MSECSTEPWEGINILIVKIQYFSKHCFICRTWMWQCSKHCALQMHWIMSPTIWDNTLGLVNTATKLTKKGDTEFISQWKEVEFLVTWKINFCFPTFHMCCDVHAMGHLLFSASILLCKLWHHHCLSQNVSKESQALSLKASVLPEIGKIMLRKSFQHYPIHFWNSPLERLALLSSQ